MQLEKESWKIIAQKIFDLGNLMVAAFIFGLLISKQGINFWLISAGIILYLSCVLIGITLLRKK
ncbi:MAG: hypothetical protein QME42_11375 [bacterium]|nr:hypothetical protein [bacterium]